MHSTIHWKIMKIRIPRGDTYFLFFTSCPQKEKRDPPPEGGNDVCGTFVQEAPVVERGRERVPAGNPRAAPHSPFSGRPAISAPIFCTAFRSTRFGTTNHSVTLFPVPFFESTCTFCTCLCLNPDLLSGRCPPT